MPLHRLVEPSPGNALPSHAAAMPSEASACSAAADRLAALHLSAIAGHCLAGPSRRASMLRFSSPPPSVSMQRRRCAIHAVAQQSRAMPPLFNAGLCRRLALRCPGKPRRCDAPLCRRVAINALPSLRSSSPCRCVESQCPAPPWQSPAMLSPCTGPQSTPIVALQCLCESSPCIAPAMPGSAQQIPRFALPCFAAALPS